MRITVNPVVITTIVKWVKPALRSRASEFAERKFRKVMEKVSERKWNYSEKEIVRIVAREVMAELMLKYAWFIGHGKLGHRAHRHYY